jgi:RNA polymerase-interacting CarD/CdnL/TRCF family regulator
VPGIIIDKKGDLEVSVMTMQPATYSKGDWIVHARYGVGQVKGIEKKELEGEKKLFFRVKTFDGVYWLSVTRTDVEYIRPITSKYKIKRALTIIRRSPKELPENHTQRSKLINEALKDSSLYPKARMLRDLNGKQHASKLNFTEEDAFLKMKKQFLNEWSIVTEMERDVLEEKLEKALETSVGKIAKAV